MEDLAEEQRHLDETSAAYDAAFAALTGRKHRSGDDYANEALEAMRRERIRVYTDASGPLYFGRVDRADGETLYVGRHAVWSRDNDLLSVNWRAPAAEPFYTATERDPQGLTRRRRLDIEERRVLGFVDEPLLTGGEDHLTEAIVDDITRQRVGEMRQIISTITPEQYGLISLPPDGALVVQGGPGTGKTAVGLHRAAWLLYADPQLAREGVLVVGPNRVFITYISQVLPALGEQSVEQRAIDGLVSRRPWATGESEERATLLGSGRMAELLSRLLWARVGPPAAPVSLSVGRVSVSLTPSEVAAIISDARERLTYEGGRARFRERLADRLATAVIAGARDSASASPEAVTSAVRQSKEYQRLATRCWPRGPPGQLLAAAFKPRRRLASTAEGLLSPEEIDLLLGQPPPAAASAM